MQCTLHKPVSLYLPRIQISEGLSEGPPRRLQHLPPVHSPPRLPQLYLEHVSAVYTLVTVTGDTSDIQ